jgi:hypothetical protein
LQSTPQGRDLEKWCSLIVLSDKEVTSLNEEDKDKMLIITNKDIQEFKDT